MGRKRYKAEIEKLKQKEREAEIRKASRLTYYEDKKTSPDGLDLNEIYLFDEVDEGVYEYRYASVGAELARARVIGITFLYLVLIYFSSGMYGVLFYLTFLFPLCWIVSMFYIYRKGRLVIDRNRKEIMVSHLFGLKKKTFSYALAQDVTQGVKRVLKQSKQLHKHYYGAQQISLSFGTNAKEVVYKQLEGDDDVPQLKHEIEILTGIVSSSASARKEAR